MANLLLSNVNALIDGRQQNHTTKREVTGNQPLTVLQKLRYQAL